MSKKQKKIISIFEKYGSCINEQIISSRGKKRNFDISRDIIEKKSEIKKLLTKKIEGEKFIDQKYNKPTGLKYEEGLKKIFSTYNIPNNDKLNIINKEQQKRKNKSNEKNRNILLSLNINQNKEEELNKSRSNLQLKLLNTSINKNEKNELKNINNYNEYNSSKNSINLLLKKKESDDESEDNEKINVDKNYYSPELIGHKSYLKNNIETFSNSTQRETITAFSNSQSKNKRLIPKIKIPSLKLNSNNYNDNIKTRNNIKLNNYYVKSLTTRSSSSKRKKKRKIIKSFSEKENFIKEEKEKAKTIQVKMDIIKINQSKLNNKLFKIIDNARYLKPLSIEFKRDAEAILDKKLKKRKIKGKTKKDVIHAVRIENSYAHMGKKNREMMEFSDNFVKLSDLAFEQFGRNIQQQYLKNVGKKKEKLDKEKKEKKLLDELRNKFNSNNDKIEKKRFNFYYTLAQTKENIEKKYFQ